MINYQYYDKNIDTNIKKYIFNISDIKSKNTWDYYLGNQYSTQIDSSSYKMQQGYYKSMSENDNITIIEWPELLKNKPNNRIEIKFKYLEDFKKREVKIRGFGNWKNYDFKRI